MMKHMYYYRDYILNPFCKSLTAWRMALFLLAFLFLQSVCGFAQTTQAISGTVVSSEDNQGLPGVSIGVKGTSAGAITDAQGRFQLQAASDAVLVVSYIGFTTQEVPVDGRSTVAITLRPDEKLLEEVVVTGYGEVRKSEVTGAQTTISSASIEKTVNTTIEQAIQGRAAGVYVTQNTGAPGGGISVNIRGVNSIGGTNEPLYVIDGVQIEGAISPSGSNPLSTLNPADIESMEILQGPSATALYGSRATNGVVLITTKRGKAGDIRINYAYLYSLQTAPEKLEVMNLRQYAQMDNEYKSIAGGNVREDFLDPSLLGGGTDWQEELFKSAPMQKHQLSLSGGSEKTTYYLSGEYLDQEGVALGSGFNRASIRLNLDNQAKEWLSIKANINYAQTDESISSTQSDVITRAIQLAPHIPVRNLDGTYGGGNVTNNSAEQFTPPNPIGLAELTQNDLTKRQLLGGLTLGFKITDDLDFSTAFNGNVGVSNSTYFLPTYQFGYQQNTVAVLNNNNSVNTSYNWNQMLTYRKQFGKHSINLMATHEVNESTWKNLYGERRGFQTNDVIDLNAGDEATSVARGGQGEWGMESYLGRAIYNYNERYIITGAFRADGSVNFGPENRWGYFPSVSAAWRVSEEEFFTVPFVSDLRLRYEIGLTGNQGGGGAIYGTLAAGPTPWGTGFIANRYPNPNFQWEETKTNNFGINLGLFENRVQIEADYYIKDTDNLILQSSLPWYMGTNGNGSIAPPTVNIGSLQNKGWSFTLNTINIDNTAFRWSSNFNLSHFKTEVMSLTTETSQIDRINWWMNNWTQRTVVGQSPWLFYGYIEEGIFGSLEEIENSALPADNNGVEFPVAENSIWVGDVKYRDINEDGIISGEDQTFIGNPWPKYYAGFTNDFSYKGFDLSILITSTIGNDIYNYLRSENTNPNNINLGRNLFVGAFDYANVQLDEEGNPYLTNPGTVVARMSGGNKNNNFSRHTDKYVEDGSFVRLKNVTLNYNLPSTVMAKLKYIKGARIGVSAQNVYTITGYSGYDPEVGSYVGPNANAGNAAIGVDYGRYPLTPVYSVNVGIDF
ncbi:TonB-dependent receptor [Pontibacter saemangeumensis]|uniref:TonB-dependent receptor n=1 Tax=Pontibacter saemangeumensis TaxID=1084525 RepID=A0ABP8M021_9BACT